MLFPCVALFFFAVLYMVKDVGSMVVPQFRSALKYPRVNVRLDGSDRLRQRSFTNLHLFTLDGSSNNIRPGDMCPRRHGSVAHARSMTERLLDPSSMSVAGRILTRYVLGKLPHARSMYWVPGCLSELG